MLDRKRGSIVNLGSISGYIVNRPQWHSPYGTAKAGVHHLTPLRSPKRDAPHKKHGLLLH